MFVIIYKTVHLILDTDYWAKQANTCRVPPCSDIHLVSILGSLLCQLYAKLRSASISVISLTCINYRHGSAASLVMLKSFISTR